MKLIKMPVASMTPAQLQPEGANDTGEWSDIALCLVP